MNQNIFNVLLKNLPKSNNIANSHSAILVQNGSVISSSWNYIKGSSTIHAEVGAIINYLSKKGFTKSWLEKDCLLWTPNLFSTNFKNSKKNKKNFAWN